MREMSRVFLITGVLSLTCGLLMGCLAGIQFLFPLFLADQLPFYAVRPLHVSLALWWIFLVATGGIYHYLAVFADEALFGVDAKWVNSAKALILARLHFFIFLFSGLAIVTCYVLGLFGGREYLEYPPYLSLPILLGWLLFLGNVFGALGFLKRDWPIFLWMWVTGIGLFLCAFVEAHLWIIPYFGGHVTRDITVQWKSYGSLVASWNMLLYGTAMCVMYLINRDEKVLSGRLPFALYFLGLVNALFNWGHHTYTVPAASWIRDTAYIISMTELILLFRIIWNWRKDLDAGKPFRHLRSYRFMLAADGWVMANLALALALSIPALNIFLHGTHAVVAHSMGTTLGINSMILLSSVYLILERNSAAFSELEDRIFQKVYVALNFFLGLFWVALIAAGVHKGYLIFAKPELPYRDVMLAIRPYLMVFVGSGIFIMLGLFFFIYSLAYGLIGFRRRSTGNVFA